MNFAFGSLRAYSASFRAPFIARPLHLMTSTTPYPTPPCLPPKWDYTPERANGVVSEAIATADAAVAAIIALPEEKRTYETVFRRLSFLESAMDLDTSPVSFLQYVSESAELRDASVAADKALQEWGLALNTNEELYKALVDAQKHTDVGALTPEESRLMDRLVRDRERNGLALSPADRARFIALKKEIMQLEIDFQKNCNEEKGFLLFSADELRGVPADVVAGYPVVDGKHKVTFKTPDIFPVFQFAQLPETRKRSTLGFEAKNEQNIPLLEAVARLRREAAGLLGFENWAEYTLDVKMAKTAANVYSFLDDLVAKLTPLGEREKAELLALKRAECAELGLPYDDVLYLWDYRYYDRLWTERNLALNPEKVKEYFPVDVVIPAILGIYKRLLNVQFYPVPRDDTHGGKTWHADASMYAVWDGGEGGFLGYMHLDLFPRENKYGHAAVWGLIPGYTKEDGSRNYPVVCMVANLAKPTGTRPALMTHDQVVTFFHEMGHAFHGLCSHTQFARFHGTAVARDFVEAPSQMLENWCWQKSILKEMSSHYETKEPLSDELIDRIIQSKNVNQGLFNLRQLFHGLFDMSIHTSEKDQDQTKLWCDLREKTSLVSTDGIYIGGQSSFAHLVGGYAAGYYGYLYSQVFSTDMFVTVFAKSPMDPALGLQYRNKILLPGGSRDEMDSLVDFLGREPSNEAFLKDIMGDLYEPAKL